jgi:putative transposase
VNSVYRTWLSQANGYCESFNSTLRDVFLNGGFLYSMKELSVLAERWRVHHNTVRPYSSLGYNRPAPAAWLTEASQGHEEEGRKESFPLFNTPDYGDEASPLPAAPR